MEELILTGNLGNDPEIRYTPGGKRVANFSLAVAAGRDDQQQPITHWYACDAWEKTAEVVEKYLHKGDKVLVRGIPRADAYIGKKDGKAVAKLCVTVNRLEMLGSRRDGQNAGQTAGQSATGETGGFTPVDMNDDELPF